MATGGQQQSLWKGRPITKSPMAKVGLAFSGGGVRSAAFCFGVLRRLL